MFSPTKRSFVILYLLTLGYMFRFSRNHNQALSKNIKIHYIKLLKRILGSPNVHNKHLVMIHMYHNQMFIVNVWGSQNAF